MSSTLFLLLLPAVVMSAPVLEGGPYPLQPKQPQAIQEYGVAVDAGSSGSRANVYSWPHQTDPSVVPDIEEVYNYKVEPGISDFVDNLDGLDPYVSRLVAMAAENVPAEAHAQTVLYFMATAGMRLLLEDKANAVMERINSLLLDPAVNPFSYDPLNTRILSGEEEGVFAWISANYLQGYFDRRKESPEELSAGILEMGGASLQIAFQPAGSILADKFPVKVGGAIYPLYVHSYLYYGQNFADLWVKQYLYDERPEKNNISNPCMLKEDVVITDVRGENVTYIGVGDPDECMEILDIYVYDVDPRRCHPKPCAIGPVYQPSIETEQPFFALGSFIYSLRTLEVLGPNGTFDLRETNSSAYEYCVKDIWTVQNETGRNDSYLSVECMTGLYIPLAMTKAFQFQQDTTQPRAVKDINEQPIAWTLGAIIYENERRNWQCPEAGNSGSVLTSSSPLALLAGIVFCLLHQSPSYLCPNHMQNTTDSVDFILLLRRNK